MIKVIDGQSYHIIESLQLLQTTFSWAFSTDIHTSIIGNEVKLGLSDDPTWRIRMFFHDYKTFAHIISVYQNMRKTFLIPIFFIRYDIAVTIEPTTTTIECDTSLYPYIQVGTFFNAIKDGYDIYLVKEITNDGFVVDRIPQSVECFDLMLSCVIDKDVKAEVSDVFANYSIDFISLHDIEIPESVLVDLPFTMLKDSEYLAVQYTQHQILHANDVSSIHSFTDWAQCKYSSPINLAIYNIEGILEVLEFFKAKRGALGQFKIDGSIVLLESKNFRFSDDLSLQCLGGFNFELSSNIVEVWE